MAKGKLTQIKIETLPNGYSLTVKGEGYFAFTLQDLFRQFIVHVGMDELGNVDMNTADEMITAMMTWKERADAVKAIVQKEIAFKTMKGKLNGMARRLEHAQRQLEDYEK